MRRWRDEHPLQRPDPHAADSLAVHRHPAREPVQAVSIRGRREAVDQLPLIVDQAHLNLFATQIQTNMQHEHSFPWEDHGQDRSSPPRTLSRWSVLFRTAGRVGHNRAPSHPVDSEGPTASRSLRRPPGGPAFIAFLRGSGRPVISAAIRMYGSNTSESRCWRRAALSSGTSAKVTRGGAAPPRGSSPTRPHQ